ncbi:MAG: DJ-1/PfpI family protein [Chitinophagaceae bacterium]|nr:DJ-1/PfpI family protein [Chitinophagaceae bacterium]
MSSIQYNRVIFFINKETHILDLAGAVQTFYESGDYGKPYEIIYVSDNVTQATSAHLRMTGLKKYTAVKVTSSDIVVIPGYDLRRLPPMDDHQLFEWLRKADKAGAIICSICTGAFTLAAAGLLEGKECTTHWKYTERLQKDYPALKVLNNRLFVKSGNIYTSAGVTTGLDMALSLLEEKHGPEFAYKVAREMVVYIRRDGSETQDSIYLQYRSHVNDDIHVVQDWMIRHLPEKIRVEQLAALVYTSPRNLTRQFKQSTGITIGKYLEKLRVEKAVHLLNNNHKMDTVTRQCGLQSTNQLRHIIKKHTGSLPSAFSVRKMLS